MQTGSVIHNPSFPNTGDFLDNIGSLRYDDTSAMVYGLFYDHSQQESSFVTVSPISGLHQSVLALPNIQTYDPESIVLNSKDREYIVNATINLSQSSLYILDLDSGTIKHNPTIIKTDSLDWISSFQMDQKGDLYALYYSDSLNLISLVEINKINGNYTKITDLPLIKYLGGFSRYYDAQFDLLVFEGTDSLNNNLLFKIDPTSGQIISTVPFPVLQDPNDNISQITYNTSNNRLYALHWDNDYITSLNETSKDDFGIRVFPNPTSEGFRVSIQSNQTIVDLLIYSNSGHLIEHLRDHSYKIDGQHFELPKGSYILLIQTQDGSRKTQKLIVE